MTQLFFRKTGSGQPLVIVHGLYGSSDNWMAIAKRLSAKFTVYLVDQRNHGLSPHVDTNSYNDMRNDLADFMDRQNIDKTILLGHSMGGKTAMHYAADYPERIKKIIVADIAPKNYLESDKNSRYYLHHNILLAMMEIDFSVIKSREDIADYLAEKIDNARIRQFLLKNVAIDKTKKGYKWKINPEVLYNYLDEIVSGVNPSWFSDRIPITNYPVLFIRGVKSDYILPEDEKLIHGIYPEAQIVDIPEAGHWLHAEQPELFEKAILQF